MRLNDPLYNEYQINGKSVELDLAFDNILDVLDILNDKELADPDKLELSCSLLVANEIDLTFDEKAEVYLYVKNTYIDPEERNFIEYDILGNPMPEINEKTIDFEKDAKFIYASFRSIGINLFQEQGKLTWMEFQALMSALPDDCIMSKIIQIRTWKPQGGESLEYKDHMKKMQKRYSLNDIEEVEDV